LAKLSEMAKIHKDYCSGPNPLARLLTIYIQEASDGKGTLNATKPVKNFHRSMADRITAANRFIEECKFSSEVICDSMADQVLERYESHPERIVIVEKGLIVHEGGPMGVVRYDLDSVAEWLRTRDTRAKDTSLMQEDEAAAECST